MNILLIGLDDNVDEVLRSIARIQLAMQERTLKELEQRPRPIILACPADIPPLPTHLPCMAPIAAYEIAKQKLDAELTLRKLGASFSLFYGLSDSFQDDMRRLKDSLMPERDERLSAAVAFIREEYATSKVPRRRGYLGYYKRAQRQRF